MSALLVSNGLLKTADNRKIRSLYIHYGDILLGYLYNICYVCQLHNPLKEKVSILKENGLLKPLGYFNAIPHWWLFFIW